MKGFKLLIILIALILLPSKAEAMRQYIPYSTGIAVSAAIDSAADFMGSNSQEVTIANASQVEGLIKVAGTFSGFRFKISTAPAAGKTWVFTLVVNGSDTAVTCTISNPDTTCNTGANTAVVASGDRVYLKISPTGTPTAVQINASVIYTTGTSGYSSFWGTSLDQTQVAGLTRYSPMVGNRSTLATTVNTAARVTVPMTGTLRRLTFRTTTAPTGSDTAIATVRKNNADTGLTCTVTGAGTTCNDDSNTVAVVQGDTLELKVVTSATAATLGYNYGWVFESGNDLSHPLFVAGPNLSASATRYNPIQGVGNLGITDTVEADIQQLGQSAMTLTNMYVLLAAAPGAGTSYTGVVRVNGVDTGVDVQVSGTNTTDSENGQTATVAQDDLLSIGWTPAGTPTATNAFTSMVANTATAVAGGEDFAFFFD